MPELPEVETVKNTLKDKIIGKKITKVDILLPRLIKYPQVDLFQKKIINKKINQLERKGKYLIIHLDDEYLMVIHLRMTGKLCYFQNREMMDKFSRLIFQLDKNDFMIFSDIRTFGVIYLIKKGEEKLIKGLYELGIEPLTKNFTIDNLFKITRNKNSNIKSFLLNQKNVSGLGNIYVDESLFLAKINPKEITKNLTFEQVKKLHYAIEKNIKQGILDGGTSFKDYVDGNGNKGHHQEKLYVYGRENKPCKVCETLIKKIKLQGRGTCYCPKCQKLDEEV